MNTNRIIAIILLIGGIILSVIGITTISDGLKINVSGMNIHYRDQYQEIQNNKISFGTFLLGGGIVCSIFGYKKNKKEDQNKKN